jgi:hypothetical protein
MIRLDPLVEELEMDVEESLQQYRNAGGTPQKAIGWFAGYLAHMIKAQPKKLRCINEFARWINAVDYQKQV